MMKQLTSLVTLLLLMITTAFADIAGRTISYETSNAGEDDFGFEAQGCELALLASISISEATDQVVPQYHGWVWQKLNSGSQSPDLRCHVTVTLNGAVVHTLTLWPPTAKSATPNVLFTYLITESMLNYGRNVVELDLAFSGNNESNDGLTIRSEVFRS